MPDAGAAQGGGMHRHYRVALIVSGAAALTLGAALLTSVAPAVAVVVGAGAGTVTLYAGAHWVRRKLGIKPSGKKWRMPRTRFTRAPQNGPGRKTGFGRPRPGGGRVLPKLGGRGRASGRSRLPGGGRSPGSGSGRRKLFGRPRPAGAGSPGGRRLLGGGRIRGGGIASGRRGSLLPKPGSRRILGRKRAGQGGAGSQGRRSRGGPARKSRKVPGRAPGTRIRRPFKGAPTKGNKGSKGGPGGAKRGTVAKRGGRLMKTGWGPPSAGRIGLRPAARAIRRGWRKARAKTTPKNGKQAKPWRKAAGIAGAGLLMPFLGAFAGVRRLARWRRRSRKAKASAGPQVAGTVPRSKKKQKTKGPVPDPQPRQSGYRPRVRRSQFYGPGGPALNRIEAATEAVEQHIGGWEPENAKDADEFLRSLPEYFAGAGRAFAHVADVLADRYPIDQAVTEHLRNVGATIAGMGDFAGEAHTAFRTAHHKELERIENPRPGEELFDVQENQ